MKITLKEDELIDVFAARIARSATAKLKETIKELNARRGDVVRVTVNMDVQELKYLLHDSWIEVERQ